MLCQFTFKNYKSYKDETTIEMQAENIEEFGETLIKNEKDNKKYLPITAIYGPNAGGKSNALEAMVCMIGMIVTPILSVKSSTKTMTPKVTPYKFSNKDETTDFEVYYIVDDLQFKYNISYLEEQIINESLFVMKKNAKRPTKIFIREKNDINLGTELKKEKVKTNNNINIPFLSFLEISYDIKIIKLATSFFLNTAVIDCGSDDFESYFLSYMCDIQEGNFKKEFINLLCNMDIDISDYRIEKMESLKKEYKIFTKHTVKDKEYELNIWEESGGTVKLFALLPTIILSLKSGSLTIVDEMDAKLHPKLIKYIIELYKNKEINKKGAQLLISSHDLTTMNKDVYRRDEILFASKNSEDISELYSLYEIRDTNGEHIRATAAFNKQYIEGRYGADPYLQKILKWENN